MPPGGLRSTLPPAGSHPVVLAGVGRVGGALARLLADHPELRVIGAADSRSIREDRSGIDLAAIVRGTDGAPRRAPRTAWRRGTLEELLGDLAPVRGTVVELTGADPVHGEPGARLMRTALGSGWNVVSANKGALALHLGDLRARADAAGLALRYSAAVGGAVPVLAALVGPLSAAGVTRIEAVVNGTTQYVLGRVAHGIAGPQALEEARRHGFAEADANFDLSGYDAAAKASLLHATVFGSPLAVEAIPREAVDAALLDRAGSLSGRRRRLVQVAAVERGTAEVRLREVPRGDPWDVEGARNRFVVTTSRAGTLVFEGPGAGPSPTASAVLGDLLAIVHAAA